jgi:hypothetical protein
VVRDSRVTRDAGKGRHRFGQPFARGLAVHGLAAREQRAAELRLLVDEDDPRPGGAGGQRGDDARRTRAHHQHVAMGIGLAVAIRIGRLGRLAEAGGAADDMLVFHPGAGRPHEGLVVEAGREITRQQIVDAADVEAQRRPAVLALGDEAVIELDLGGAHIGLGAIARAQLDQRIGLVGARGHDAARAMIFEAPPDEMDAIGEQGRGKGVAGIALVALAVEGEAERPGAVDAAAPGRTMGLLAHGCSPIL